MLVFSHQQSPCTWSLPCLYEQNTLRAKCGGVNPLNSISKTSEPAIMMHTRCRQLLLLMPEQGGRTSQERWTCQTKIKFKTKTGLTKEGGITIGNATTGGATSRILIFKSKLRYNALPQLPRARSWSNLKWALGRTHVFLWTRVLWLSRGLPPFRQQTRNHWRDKCCHTR